MSQELTSWVSHRGLRDHLGIIPRTTSIMVSLGDHQLPALPSVLGLVEVLQAGSVSFSYDSFSLPAQSTQGLDF